VALEPALQTATLLHHHHRIATDREVAFVGFLIGGIDESGHFHLVPACDSRPRAKSRSASVNHARNIGRILRNAEQRECHAGWDGQRRSCRLAPPAREIPCCDEQPPFLYDVKRCL
jgi:hypothetical protein